MNYGPVFAGRRFAVMGLGKAGLPAAVALRDMGADVFVWDDAAKARAAAGGFWAMRPSEIPGKKVDALVLSPGIAHKLPKPHEQALWARKAGVPILTDAELLFQAVRAAGSKAKFVGVTGTNGKSTTTALIAHILRKAGVPCAAGANLGPAALSLPLLPDDGVYVLEMSSYMLERIASLRFDVAVLLNLSPDHIDRHGDMAGYVAAKREIFARQDAACVAVIGVDDAGTREVANWLHTRDAAVMRVSGARAIAVAAPALVGVHNAQNAAAAGAVARALGIGVDVVNAALETFPGLPHRMQPVGIVDAVRFINDSKATNADAAAQAMACYDRFVWIAGGVAKEGGIEALAPFFPRVVKAFLIGKDGPVFAKTLAKYGIKHEQAETLGYAVPLGLAEAKAAGVETVLFSPAAASFDQFANFEARGERFAALVKEAM